MLRTMVLTLRLIILGMAIHQAWAAQDLCPFARQQSFPFQFSSALDTAEPIKALVTPRSYACSVTVGQEADAASMGLVHWQPKTLTRPLLVEWVYAYRRLRTLEKLYHYRDTFAYEITVPSALRSHATRAFMLSQPQGEVFVHTLFLIKMGSQQDYDILWIEDSGPQRWLSSKAMTSLIHKARTCLRRAP
jgi:hypothetical protein